MIPEIVEARHIRGFVLHLRFSDGMEGDLNLEAELHGEIFEPLKDPTYFRRISVNPELHTVTWPNGADFAPEFLYTRVRERAEVK